MLVEAAKKWWIHQTERGYAITFTYFRRDDGEVIELDVNNPNMEMMGSLRYSLLSQFRVVGMERRSSPLSRWRGRNLYTERITNLLNGETWSVMN